jgi:hypothetical protein
MAVFAMVQVSDKKSLSYGSSIAGVPDLTLAKSSISVFFSPSVR